MEKKTKFNIWYVLAALGYTQQRPTEDRYLMSTSELLGKIDVLLGGRMAEQLIFNSVTTGAGNDLMRATDIARAMIVEYGMGKTLGLSTYPRQRSPVFLHSEQGGPAAKDYSDDTAARVDNETKQILDDRSKHVAELLTDHKDRLIAIAERLLEKEVLYEEEFMQMVNLEPVPAT
jgi:cell division protease FtsH